MVFVDYDKKLSQVEQLVKNADHPEENKQLIFDFETYMFMEGLEKSTIKNNLFNINYFSKTVNKPFSQLQKRDIESYVGYIQRHLKTDYSRMTKKATLKKFFRWYNGGTDPEVTSWLNVTTKKTKRRKLPEDLLTTDEVKAMIDAADYVRDRALIAVLYDTGARVSEIGNLKIKDVNFDQYGGVLNVSGKTGMRRIRIIFSVPYLNMWLDTHPKRDNPDSYLWVTLARQSKGVQLKYDSMYDNIRKIAKKAGIEKRIYNHLFRHSRATELAQHLTQAQMEEHLGWIHGSNMPQTYIHMSGKQVDDAILKMHGLKKDEETQPELTARQCPRCDEMNGPTSKFCSRCGAALDTQTAMELDEKKSSIMQRFMDMVKNDPELLSMIQQKGENEDKNQ